ncbi:FAD-binding monooxygenase [Nocardia panacis]|uniref:FAD-binding monooxygenase n=1 Tax=Nocardia panacis TaxID=2340916 RepID=A0A3A4KKF5_9NOCA|nr:FAD-dependent monooxygenase [Nocardia panacis]RJO73467.1 FAD-binding monooxygenase [Nocardia panacis]
MGTTGHDIHILVSGGGIAGNAVALQLLRAGIRTTVLERAAAPRPGGQAVDLRGASREVAERMGLMAGIRKTQLHELGFAHVDAQGREFGVMPVEMFDGKGPIADIEISRGDLNQVLLDAVAEAADGWLDYRYGDWITDLRQDDSGVDVTFASGGTERFDLVIGADGLHSTTRALVFGPEEQFRTYLGGYISFFTLPTPSDIKPGWMALRTVPKANFGIRPDYDPDTCKAIISLRIPEDPALRRDPAAQKQRIRDHLTGAGWHAETVVAAMDRADDFYFDILARVDLPTLSKGRVVMLGDAGYCGSPMTGMGTAMAIVGAYVLAGEIAATPDDLTGALARHEQQLRPFLEKAQEIPGGGLSRMLPDSAFGLKMMRLTIKIMMAKPLRPLVAKMFFGKTDDYVLPTY